jgi:hypothetical protein
MTKTKPQGKRPLRKRDLKRSNLRLRHANTRDVKRNTRSRALQWYTPAWG